MAEDLARAYRALVALRALVNINESETRRVLNEHHAAISAATQFLEQSEPARIAPFGCSPDMA